MTATLTRTAADHDEAIAREYPGLLDFCHHLDWRAPEDLAQEAAVRTLRRMAIVDIDDLGAYMRTTARHIRNDMLRTQRSRRVVLTAEPDAGLTEDPDVADRLARTAGLNQALRRLSSRERAVLWMADVEERSVEEIAAATGYSVSSTTSVLYRARHKLRSELLRLKERGLLAVATPLAFLRQIAAALNPEALGAAAVAGAAALAIVIGAATHSPPTQSLADVAGRATTVDHAPSGLTATPSAAIEPSPAGPTIQPHHPADPGDTAAPGHPERPPAEGLPTPRIDQHPRADHTKPIAVTVGANCTEASPTYVDSDPWSEEGKGVFHGTPPPGGDALEAHADIPQPDESCQYTTPPRVI